MPGDFPCTSLGGACVISCMPWFYTWSVWEVRQVRENTSTQLPISHLGNFLKPGSDSDLILEAQDQFQGNGTTSLRDATLGPAGDRTQVSFYPGKCTGQWPLYYGMWTQPQCTILTDTKPSEMRRDQGTLFFKMPWSGSQDFIPFTRQFIPIRHLFGSLIEYYHISPICVKDLSFYNFYCDFFILNIC